MVSSPLLVLVYGSWSWFSLIWVLVLVWFYLGLWSHLVLGPVLLVGVIVLSSMGLCLVLVFGLGL